MSDKENQTNHSTTNKRSPFKRTPWFWLCVALPTAISAVYFGLMASDQFVSQSSFVVRSNNNQNSSASGFGALLQGVGIARSQDDTYTVQEYMRSRSALESLSQNIPVRSFYEEQGDIFSRFNGFGLSNYDEAFYNYYSKKVSVQFDPISGIAVLSVQGFDAEQSQKINAALLSKGEDLINQLNTRARNDSVAFSKQNVEEAEQRVRDSAQALTQFRIDNGVLDLKEDAAMQMSLISQLQGELISIRSQLDQVRAITPDNPQIDGLKTREISLTQEIERQTRQLTGASNKSTANKASNYQRLILENELAEKQLIAAMAALETARAEADRQQLYLEVISTPSRPDMPRYPERLYNIITTFIISLVIYGLGRLMAAGIKEHQS